MNPHGHLEPGLAVPIGIDINSQLNDFVGGIPNIVSTVNVGQVSMPGSLDQMNHQRNLSSKQKRELTRDEEDERLEKRRRREKEKREGETPEEKALRTSKRRARDSAHKEQIINTEEWERRKNRRRENDKKRRESLTQEQREELNEKRRAIDRQRRENRTNNSGNDRKTHVHAPLDPMIPSAIPQNIINPISQVQINTQMTANPHMSTLQVAPVVNAIAAPVVLHQGHL